MTRESFQAMSRAMNPDGVLVINAFCKFEPGKNFFASSLYKTLKAVFKNVRIHREGESNTYFVASNGDELKMHYQPDFSQVCPQCREQVKSGAMAMKDIHDLPGGMVMTDDYNPAEYYDAPNREAVRKSLAFMMQRL